MVFSGQLLQDSKNTSESMHNIALGGEFSLHVFLEYSNIEWGPIFNDRIGKGGEKIFTVKVTVDLQIIDALPKATFTPG